MPTQDRWYVDLYDKNNKIVKRTWLQIAPLTPNDLSAAGPPKALTAVHIAGAAGLAVFLIGGNEDTIHDGTPEKPFRYYEQTSRRVD